MHSYIQNNQIQKNHSVLSCARILHKEIRLYKEINSYAKRFCQNSWYKIAMDKTKVEVYKEVLRDVSQNFERPENFIKLQVEVICEWKKISVEELFHFYIFLYIFSVIARC